MISIDDSEVGCEIAAFDDSIVVAPLASSDLAPLSPVALLRPHNSGSMLKHQSRTTS